MVLTIKNSSLWIRWFSLCGLDRPENICEFGRKVLLSAFITVVAIVFAGAVMVWVGCMLAVLFNLYQGSPEVFTLGVLGWIFTGFVAYCIVRAISQRKLDDNNWRGTDIPWWAQKVFKDKVEVKRAREPSLVGEWYKAFKNKTCVKIEYNYDA